MRQIVLDTETTGLDPQQGHRIIEIGCIELQNRRFTGQDFHFYLNPERHVDEQALQVHGISNQFLADKPKFHQIYTQLVDYLSQAELIIHNAPFDVGFINHELAQLPATSYRDIKQLCTINDTLEMARQKHPGQRNSLDALCKRYRIDNTSRELHGALLDARILAQVYLAMTGGQSSFIDFDAGIESREQNSSLTQQSLPQQHWELPIIKASQSEQAEHEAYLDQIASQAQQVVWRSSEID